MRTVTPNKGYWLLVCRVPVCLLAFTKELDLQLPELREVLYWIFLLKFAGTLLVWLKSEKKNTLYTKTSVFCFFLFTEELFFGGGGGWFFTKTFLQKLRT